MKQHQLPQNLLDTLIRQTSIIHPKSLLSIEFDEDIVSSRLQEARIGQSRSGIVVTINNLPNEKKNKRYKVINKNEMYKLPYKSSMFDLIVCCGILEHLKNPLKALAELQRVTKQYIILSVPNEPKFRIANMMSGRDLSRAGNPSDHVQHWSGDGFELFAAKKFTVFTKKEPFPWVVLVGEKN